MLSNHHATQLSAVVRQAVRGLARNAALRRAFAAGLVLVLNAGVLVSGQDASTRESAIKAAYLFNFIKYIEWPADVLAPGAGVITLGILGENPFGQTIQSLHGKSVKGRKLVVKQGTTIAELGDCQLLFISASEKDRLNTILEALQARRIVTVSELQGFAENGGIINFIEERNKVRFQINLEAARRRGLTISSDLLKLAKIVGA